MKAALTEFRDTADALLTRAESLHAEDKEAERLSKRWGTIAVVSLLLGIFGTPLWAGLASITGGIGAVVWVIWGALFVVGLVKWLRHRAHDLDDRKVATLSQVVRILRADVPPSTPLHAVVDFREYKKGGRELANERAGSVRSLRYEHDWFKMRATLADGSEVALEISDSVKRKEKSKRKYTKVNEQACSHVLVTVRFAKRYGDLAGVAERLQAGPPPTDLTVARVTGRGRTVSASLRTGVAQRRTGRGSTTTGTLDGLAAGDTLLLALRWVYDGAAPLARSA